MLLELKKRVDGKVEMKGFCKRVVRIIADEGDTTKCSV